MPKGIVDVALLGSPLVAMASAAHIDLVRMDTLYQISTLAHLGVDYPAWSVTAVCYLAAAVIGLAGLAWISGAGGHVPLRRPSAHSPN